MTEAPNIEAPKYITAQELADRWRISPHTLRTWRRKEMGPPVFLPLGQRGIALYRLDDIEAWEAKNTRVKA